MRVFNQEYDSISGGTVSIETPTLDPTNVFSILGTQYTGYTTDSIATTIDVTRLSYPVDSMGYPLAPEPTSNYYFQ